MDLNEIYDQVEMALPGTRVKRRLKIAPSTGQPLPFDARCRSQLSPTKYLPSIAEERESKVYGQPSLKGKSPEDINAVMHYDYLNDTLRQRIREKFLK